MGAGLVAGVRGTGRRSRPDGVRWVAGVHADTVLEGLGPWAREVPGLRQLSPEEVPGPYEVGLAARLPLIDMPVHLTWLRSRFETAGGVVERRVVSGFGEAAARARVVVDCTGAAARELVPDPAVRPVRGSWCWWRTRGSRSGSPRRTPGRARRRTSSRSRGGSSSAGRPRRGRAAGTRSGDGGGDRRALCAGAAGDRGGAGARSPGGPAAGAGGRGPDRGGAAAGRWASGAPLRARGRGGDGVLGLRGAGGGARGGLRTTAGRMPPLSDSTRPAFAHRIVAPVRSPTSRSAACCCSPRPRTGGRASPGRWRGRGRCGPPRGRRDP